MSRIALSPHKHCIYTVGTFGDDQKDDVSQHIKPNKIKKANASVRQVLHVLREIVNPFEMTGESLLFNIVTGKSNFQKQKISS